MRIDPSLPQAFVDVSVDRRGIGRTRVGVVGSDDVGVLEPDVYIAMGANVSSAARLMHSTIAAPHRSYVDLSTFRLLYRSMGHAITAATVNSLQRVIDGAAADVRNVAMRIDESVGVSSDECLRRILQGLYFLLGPAEGAELFSSVNTFALFLGASALSADVHQDILERWQQKIVRREQADLGRAPTRAFVDADGDEVAVVGKMFSPGDVELINELLEEAWADREQLTVPQRPSLNWLHAPHMQEVLGRLAKKHAAHSSEEILDRLSERLMGRSICRFFLAPDGGLARIEAWEGGARINALGSKQRTGFAVDALMYRRRINRRLRYVPVEYTRITGDGPALHPFMRWYHGRDFERARRGLVTQERLTRLMFADGVSAPDRLSAFITILEGERGVSARVAELHAAQGRTYAQPTADSGRVVRWLIEAARAGQVDRVDEVGVFYVEHLLRKAVGDQRVDRAIAAYEPAMPPAGMQRTPALGRHLTLVGSATAAVQPAAVTSFSLIRR